MDTVALIRKPGKLDCGVGRYLGELENSLITAGFKVVQVYPIVPIPKWFLTAIKNLLGWDLEEFFNNYPIWIHYPQANLYHLTSQNLATLMVFHRPPGKTVLSVHDLIYLENRSLIRSKYPQRIAQVFFEHVAMIGIRKVKSLITDSHYSRSVIQKHLVRDTNQGIQKRSTSSEIRDAG